MPNITIHLDDETHRVAKLYAAEHGTSISEVFRQHIRSIATPAAIAGAVQRYSRGQMPVKDTMSAMGLQTREELYEAVANAGLDLPRADSGTIDRQASFAAKILQGTRQHA